MRAFSSFAEGIQGAFVGYSRGIRVPKRVFRILAAAEPSKTLRFLIHRTSKNDFELPFYNIKRGRQPEKNGKRSGLEGLEFYHGFVVASSPFKGFRLLPWLSFANLT